MFWRTLKMVMCWSTLLYFSHYALAPPDAVPSSDVWTGDGLGADARYMCTPPVPTVARRGDAQWRSVRVRSHAAPALHDLNITLPASWQVSWLSRRSERVPLSSVPSVFGDFNVTVPAWLDAPPSLARHLAGFGGGQAPWRDAYSALLARGGFGDKHWSQNLIFGAVTHSESWFSWTDQDACVAADASALVGLLEHVDVPTKEIAVEELYKLAKTSSACRSFLVEAGAVGALLSAVSGALVRDSNDMPSYETWPTDDEVYYLVLADHAFGNDGTIYTIRPTAGRALNLIARDHRAAVVEALKPTVALLERDPLSALHLLIRIVHKIDEANELFFDAGATPLILSTFQNCSAAHLQKDVHPECVKVRGELARLVSSLLIFSSSGSNYKVIDATLLKSGVLEELVAMLDYAGDDIYNYVYASHALDLLLSSSRHAHKDSHTYILETITGLGAIPKLLNLTKTIPHENEHLRRLPIRLLISMEASGLLNSSVLADGPREAIRAAGFDLDAKTPRPDPDTLLDDSAKMQWLAIVSVFSYFVTAFLVYVLQFELVFGVTLTAGSWLGHVAPRVKIAVWALSRAIVDVGGILLWMLWKSHGLPIIAFISLQRFISDGTPLIQFPTLVSMNLVTNGFVFTILIRSMASWIYSLVTFVSCVSIPIIIFRSLRDPRGRDFVTAFRGNMKWEWFRFRHELAKMNQQFYNGIKFFCFGLDPNTTCLCGVLFLTLGLPYLNWLEFVVTSFNVPRLSLVATAADVVFFVWFFLSPFVELAARQQLLDAVGQLATIWCDLRERLQKTLMRKKPRILPEPGDVCMLCHEPFGDEADGELVNPTALAFCDYGCGRANGHAECMVDVLKLRSQCLICSAPWSPYQQHYTDIDLGLSTRPPYPGVFINVWFFLHSMILSLWFLRYEVAPAFVQLPVFILWSCLSRIFVISCVFTPNANE